ncbi:MAG: InlB B-repeat-containing protein [Anaerolineae bacterium]
MSGKSLRLLALLLIVGSLWPSRSIAATGQGYGEPGIWENLGLRGGMPLALAISPDFAADNLVLAGEHQSHRHPLLQSGIGIRYSFSGGLHWHPAAIAPPYDTLSTTLSVHDFAFSPTYTADRIVFAATWTGLFRSNDGAQSWSVITGTDQFITSVAVAPDFASSAHVMAGEGYFGATLYVSADGGQNWTSHQGVSSRSDIAYSPNFAVDGTAFTAGDGVYLTANRGISWTQVLTAPTFALAVSPQFAADATLFAAGVDSIYSSADGGASWISRTVTTGTAWIHALAISPAFNADGTLFAGSAQGLFRSTDRGEHWDAVQSYPGSDVRSLALATTWASTPILLAGSTRGSGIYRSDDGGVTWDQGKGLAPLEVTQLLRGPDPFQLTTATARHGVYQSADLGSMWRFAGLGGPSGTHTVALSPNYSLDHTMLASVSAGAGFTFYRTTDGGSNWEALTSSDYPGGGLAFSPAFPADSVVFATGQHGKVLRSTDLGATWEPVGAPPTGTYSLGAWHVALPPTYPTDGTLFAGGNGFWRLPPGAEIWQLAATELLTGTTITSLAVSPNYAADHTLFATAQRTEPDYTTSSGVYRSADGGVTWMRLVVGLPPADAALPPKRIAFSPDYATDHTLFALTETQIYRSRDGGDRWTAIDVPPVVTPLGDVTGGLDGNVYTGGKDGVQRYTTTAWNILADGGFETGTGWSLPETAHPAGYTSNPVYSGAQALRVGIDEGDNIPAYSSARQTLTLPSNTVNATLSCQVWPVTGESGLAGRALPFTRHTPNATPAAGDAQYLLIMDGTTVLETLFWELSHAADWQPRVFDLSAYRGQTITLHFGVLNDGAGGITALYVDDAALVVDNTAPTSYTLEVNVAGEGAVAVDPEQETYDYGDVVTLTATAATGWDFAGWSGALTGNANPTTLLMDGNKVVTATFEPEINVTPDTLNVTLSPGMTTARLVTVSNRSDADLVWQLLMDSAVGWLRLDWQTTIGLPITTPPGGSDASTTFFDANGLATGIYTTTLVVSTDNPTHSHIDIPVTLNVGYEIYLPVVMKSGS